MKIARANNEGEAPPKLEVRVRVLGELHPRRMGTGVKTSVGVGVGGSS